MDAKETILTVIKANGWVTGIRRYDLLADLQHYGMNTNMSDALVQECLSEGLIIIENDKFKMTPRGQKYLQNIARSNYIETAHRLANAPSSNATGRKRWGMEQWSWLAGIIATIIAVLTFLYEFVLKK